MMVAFFSTERLEFEEYVDFLQRSDLGSQYPLRHEVAPMIVTRRKAA